jgi:hypothetical protein
MAFRLAAYSAGQPPGMASRVAMADRESPGCTAYLAAGYPAWRGAGLAFLAGAVASVLVRMSSVLLLLMVLIAAVRVLAGPG